MKKNLFYLFLISLVSISMTVCAADEFDDEDVEFDDEGNAIEEVAEDEGESEDGSPAAPAVQSAEAESEALDEEAKAKLTESTQEGAGALSETDAEKATAGPQFTCPKWKDYISRLNAKADSPTIRYLATINNEYAKVNKDIKKATALEEFDKTAVVEKKPGFLANLKKKLTKRNETKPEGEPSGDDKTKPEEAKTPSLEKAAEVASKKPAPAVPAPAVKKDMAAKTEKKSKASVGSRIVGEPVITPDDDGHGGYTIEATLYIAGSGIRSTSSVTKTAKSILMSWIEKKNGTSSVSGFEFKGIRKAPDGKNWIVTAHVADAKAVANAGNVMAEVAAATNLLVLFFPVGRSRSAIGFACSL